MASIDPQAEDALEADNWSGNSSPHDDDADSGISVSNITASSESLRSSILRHRIENGRTYHAFREGVYVLPNDEIEKDRLDLQHHLFGLTFEGNLFLSPAGKDKPIGRVFDAGTGTGIWASDFADLHPDAEVIGVDLSPIQPYYVPPNLRFYIDDLEDSWSYSERFDFIYGRMLTGSLKDWPAFIQKSFDNLNSGGWLELADILLDTRSDDNTVPDDSPSRVWGKYMMEASWKFGAPLDSCLRYREQMEAAGFVDITVRVFKWPTNPWPRHPRYKELGLWTNENICNGVSGLSLALFTRALGWTAEQVEVFLVDVRKDMKDRHVHGWWPIYVVYGRKP